MNKERILQLADVIEKKPHRRRFNRSSPNKKLTGFNMSEWHCGTVGCIAGWTQHLFGTGTPNYDSGIEAAKLLGLHDRAATDLFIPGKAIFCTLDEVKPRQAAAVLRHLAETGKVDWSITP